MAVRINPSWYRLLEDEFQKPYWDSLTHFVKEEYIHNNCFPEGKNIFRAYDLTPFESVKVVILGQDPYHTPGAAMGLSFSVPDGSKPQPSLRNIFKEITSDLGISRTKTDLTDWAEQGVLLLNAVLTVRQGEPNSHQGKGWENFTDATIHALSGKGENIVFILWGAYAIAKKSLIDTTKHLVLTSPHPSPFSADRGFFGSKPFSRANEYLISSHKTPIHW
ncbi:MAG: uracil-DNA glycosylase [Candidatus Altimarinota bacterium]